MPDALEIPGAEYVGPASGGAAPEIPGAEYVGPAQGQKQATPSQYFAAHPNMDPLAVQSAFQQLNQPNHTAIPTTPEMAARGQMQVENQQRGAGGSFGAGVLQNFNGLAGRAQKMLAGPVGLIAPGAAENMRIAAERSEDFAPSQQHQFAGQVGQFAGGLPYAFTGAGGAVLNAVNTGEQAYHGIEERRDEGQQISGLQAGADVALQSALTYLMTRVGQKNLTGPLAPQLVKSQLPTIAKMFGPKIANVLASAVLETGTQAGQQILSNLATKGTIDHNQDILENVPEAGTSGFGLGLAGRAIHEGIEHHQYNTLTPTAPRGETQAAQVKQFRGPTLETGEGQNAPQQAPPAQIQPPQQHVDSTYRVAGEGPYQVGGNTPDKGTPHPNFNRLPSPPENVRDLSNGQIRQWMRDNGYSAPEKGLMSKTRLLTEIERQRTAPAVGQRSSPVLPDGANGWDAGQLRRWAGEQGIEIPKHVEDQAAQGQPRKVLYNYIREASGNVTGNPSLVSHVPAVRGGGPEGRVEGVRGEQPQEPAAHAGLHPGTESLAPAPTGRVTRSNVQPHAEVAGTDKSFEIAGPNRNQIPLASGEHAARPEPFGVEHGETLPLKGEQKPAAKDEGTYGVKPVGEHTPEENNTYPVKQYLPAQGGHDENVKSVGGKIVPTDKLHESHQEVLKVARELTGKDAIAYTGGKGRGFHVNGNVYYNVERNSLMSQRREAIAHEATHWLQANKPELVKPIADAIPASYGDKLMAEYEKAYEKQEGQKLPADQRQKELEAFVVGKAMSRPAVMKSVMNENPSAFAKFADAVMTKLRSLTAKGRLTNQIIESLRAAREAAGNRVGGEENEGTHSAQAEGFHTASNRQNLPAALTGEGSIYKEEIKPRLEKLANAAEWGFKTLRNVFPVESGAAHPEAANTFRARFGEAANNVHRAEVAFEEARKGFDKAGKDENLDFMRRMYDGQKQATPELQKIADNMYADANEGRQKLVKLGNDAAKAWSDHWFNMMWKKDQSKADLMLSASRPGKIEGQAGFLKKRALGEFEDGLKQGLVPKYDNPVEMFLATKAEREKFMAGYAGMDDLAKAGLIKRLGEESQVPAGWEPVPSGAKGVLKNIIKGEGEVYAPKGVGRILNNIVTPSKIGNNPIFRLAMDANNVATQTLLGLSAFHLRKVTQELVNLNVARALDMKIQGQEGAGKVLAKSAISPKDAVQHGGDVQKLMLGMKKASPEQARVVDAMVQGGMRAKGDSIYETQFSRKFGKAIRQGGLQGYLRAAAYALPAANETLMQKGVFNYVQRAKLHMGYELTNDFLKKNPDATPSQIRSEVGKISDHLDNVLGLMVRDNLFWNRTARDLATLSTLSVGWNYGSGRELAGGVVDLGKGLGSLAKGKGMDSVDTRRISYLATTGALTALTGAALTYMATGKAPQSLRDYVFPPTGAKDRNGHDVRLNTGFYTTDYFDFFHDPVGTLKAKGSPILHEASDLISNRDFKGNKIFDTDDGWYKAAGDIAKYLIKANAPLSLSQLHDTITSGGTESKSTGLKVAGLLGVKTASKKLSMSDAEIEAQHLLGQKSQIGGRTPEEAAKHDLLNNLADELREHKAGALADIRQAVRERKLLPRDVSTIQKRSKEPVGLAGTLRNTELHADDLMKIWGKMTPAERRQNQWTIRGRIGREEMTHEQKRAYFQQISKDVKDAVGK